MKKAAKFFLIAFWCYLIGHVLWSLSIYFESPLFVNSNFEIWLINIPFGLFAIFGLIGSINFYKNNK